MTSSFGRTASTTTYRTLCSIHAAHLQFLRWLTVYINPLWEG